MENKKEIAKKNVSAFEKNVVDAKSKSNTNYQKELQNNIGGQKTSASIKSNDPNSSRKVSQVRSGSLKGPKLGRKVWSKTKTAIVASLLILITLGCFGTTGWIVFTQFRAVEITGTTYVCTVENGKEKEVELISKNTATLSFLEQGEGNTVANVGDRSLEAGQYLKVVYDLNNIGPKDITLRFEIVANKRDNFDVSLKKDGETTSIGLLGQLYDVDLKKGETRQVIFYIEVSDSSAGADCDISISNSFYNRTGGSLWTLFK